MIEYKYKFIHIIYIIENNNRKQNFITIKYCIFMLPMSDLKLKNKFYRNYLLLILLVVSSLSLTFHLIFIFLLHSTY